MRAILTRKQRESLEHFGADCGNACLDLPQLKCQRAKNHHGLHIAVVRNKSNNGTTTAKWPQRPTILPEEMTGA